MDTAEAALLVCNNAANVINDAGMHLRKWMMNSTSVQHLSEEREGINEDMRLTVRKTKKILGVLWYPEDDVHGFDTSDIMQLIASMKTTKRNVLKAAAQIYDPYGFPSRFTVKDKLIFQQLWKKQLN